MKTESESNTWGEGKLGTGWGGWLHLHISRNEQAGGAVKGKSDEETESLMT